MHRRLKFVKTRVSAIEWVEEPTPDLLRLVHSAVLMAWLVLQELRKVLLTWQVPSRIPLRQFVHTERGHLFLLGSGVDTKFILNCLNLKRDVGTFPF